MWWTLTRKLFGTVFASKPLFSMTVCYNIVYVSFIWCTAIFLISHLCCFKIFIGFVCVIVPFLHFYYIYLFLVVWMRTILSQVASHLNSLCIIDVLIHWLLFLFMLYFKQRANLVLVVTCLLGSFVLCYNLCLRPYFQLLHRSLFSVSLHHCPKNLKVPINIRLTSAKTTNSGSTNWPSNVYRDVSTLPRW